MTERPIQPCLETERLTLRPFDPSDAPAVRTLAGEREVALNTVNIPHPYELRDAHEWIASHDGQLHRREAVTFAVSSRADDRLIGAVGLILDPANDSAELGYWIGKPYWGQGYATEATRAVVAWAFASLGLNRIHAGHFPRNPASGRVLQKLGMSYEGCSRGQVKKWGEYLDLERYGMLRSDYDAAG